MKKITLFIISMLLCISCGDIDNYVEPSSTLEGGIYDKVTKELIPGQAPNGARIQAYEVNSTQPINFWCNADGTFHNKRVFASSYSIIPEGPFITTPSDSIHINLPTKEKVSFYVEPHLRIVATAILNSNTAQLKFRITKSTNSSGFLTQYAILYSWTKHIDYNNYIQREIINVNQNNESNILGEEIILTIRDIDTSKPVYLRVAAKSSITNYYNYSTIIEL